MSIASEITRLQNAKLDLKTVLNAKNDSEHQITNETIDEYSDFVDSISVGGEDSFAIDKSVDYAENIEWFPGNINATTGVYTPATEPSTYYTTDYIDVEGLEYFTLIQDASSSPLLAYNACFFDENKNWLSRSVAAAGNRNINGGILVVIEVPTGAKYFRCASVNAIKGNMYHMYKLLHGSNIEVTGAEWTSSGIATGQEPSGEIIISGTSIQAYALSYKPNLRGIVGNNVTSIQTGAMISDSALRYVTLPNVINIYSNVFNGCSSLKNVLLPKITSSIQSGTFNGCSNLELLDIGSCSAIAATSINNCSKLKEIVLRKSASITTLSNVNAFNGTPYTNGGTGGTIYIPKALYDHLGDGTALDYKSATNWSIIDGYGTITWKQIEGSEYEE